MALADGRPVLSTVSRKNFLDPRGTNISFRSDMPQALDRLIGGVLAEDWAAVGMYTQGSGSQVLDSWICISLTKSHTSRRCPRAVRQHWLPQQIGAVIFAQLYSRLGTDMALSNKMRLWVDGQSNAVNVPDDQQVRFYHPDSGYTYVARSYGTETIDGKDVDRGIASRMVQHANALLARGLRSASRHQRRHHRRRLRYSAADGRWRRTARSRQLGAPRRAEPLRWVCSTHHGRLQQSWGKDLSSSCSQVHLVWPRQPSPLRRRLLSFCSKLHDNVLDNDISALAVLHGRLPHHGSTRHLVGGCDSDGCSDDSDCSASESCVAPDREIVCEVPAVRH